MKAAPPIANRNAAVKRAADIRMPVLSESEQVGFIERVSPRTEVPHRTAQGGVAGEASSRELLLTALQPAG